MKGEGGVKKSFFLSWFLCLALGSFCLILSWFRGFVFGLEWVGIFCGLFLV